MALVGLKRTSFSSQEKRKGNVRLMCSIIGAVRCLLSSRPLVPDIDPHCRLPDADARTIRRFLEHERHLLEVRASGIIMEHMDIEKCVVISLI